MMTREYGKGYDEGYADGLKDATQSLAQPEQEPVAWYDKDGVITANPIEFSQPLYTTPPQRKSLKFEQLFKLWEEDTSCDMPDTFKQFKHTARSIEAAHGIKE